jgi:acetyl esterase/lipase
MNLVMAMKEFKEIHRIKGYTKNNRGGIALAYPEIKKINYNPSLKGLAEIYPDIVFSLAQRNGTKMTIISPQIPEDSQEKYPCIVFVQGSGWTFPNIYYQIPQLSQLAAKGYVIATITHRNSLEGYQWPACLQDVKTAIRFMRAKSAEYHIDSDRIGIWGTSSGGNLALLTGLTSDDPKYRTEEYADFSDRVNLVVDCFGPTDLLKRKARLDNPTPADIALAGGNPRENMDVFIDMSPFYKVKEGLTYPSFLLVQGNKDELVPYEQSINMFHKLCDCGADAHMIEVNNGPHEGTFWSQELLDMIFGFIMKRL